MKTKQSKYKGYTIERKASNSFYVARLSRHFTRMDSAQSAIDNEFTTADGDHNCYSKGAIMNGSNGAGHYCVECGNPID